MVVEEPIDETYFRWLCAKVINIAENNYWDLMRTLYTEEFVWLISGDKNRAADGKELRIEFFNETGIERDETLLLYPCSLLEMFIAFSRVATFQIDNISAREWFWEFMANLGLDEYRRVSDSDALVIQDILYTFVWRTYDSKGDGGMFPLRRPERDQNDIEIWWQFCDYLEDRGLLQDLV